MTAIQAPHIVLPGDDIPSDLLPNPQQRDRPLTLGPGLRHTPPRTITSTVAGALHTDARKNALWLENNAGRYTPTPNDLVIAQVLPRPSAPEFYACVLTPQGAPALLPHLAFEGATKKTRPLLQGGAVVYARVVSAASRDAEAELACVAAGSGKADGLGPLTGGMVWEVSTGFARRLMMPEGAGKEEREGGAGGVVVLRELGERGLRFEVAVGRNGRVWVAGENVATVIKVGKALQEVDQRVLGVREQREVVRRVMKGG